MSYFYNSIRHDKYVIDEKYFKNYTGVVYLPLIEIYDKEIIDFDFTNVEIECSNENLKKVKINKIRIDYGDGESDIVSESILSKKSSIGDSSMKSWKEISHSFITQSKHVYDNLKEITSYPHITITFYNQFNDKFYFVIPYKILYKSFYDASGELSLMDANINNNNITSFTLRERKSNSIVVVLSSSTDLIENITSFSDPILMADSSDDYYVDDEDMVWNWSIYPELEIINSSSDCDIEDGLYDITLDWKEKKVNLYKFEIWREKMGTSEERQLASSDFTIRPFEDKNRKEGIYKYTFEIKGINELSNTITTYVKCQSYYPSEILVPTDKEIVKEIVSEPTFDISFSLKSTSKTPTSFDMFNKFNIKLLNVDNLLEYTYDVLKADFKDHEEVYSFNISTDVIPDGNYNITLDVEDVCGGKSTGFHTVDGEIIISRQFKVSYGIGQFKNITINDEKIEDLDILNEKIIRDTKDIDIDWKFIKNNTVIEENISGNADFFDLILEPESPNDENNL